MQILAGLAKLLTINLRRIGPAQIMITMFGEHVTLSLEEARSIVKALTLAPRRLTGTQQPNFGAASCGPSQS